MNYNLTNLIATIGLCTSGVIMCATVIFTGVMCYRIWKL